MRVFAVPLYLFIKPEYKQKKTLLLDNLPCNTKFRLQATRRRKASEYRPSGMLSSLYQAITEIHVHKGDKDYNKFNDTVNVHSSPLNLKQLYE